MAIANGVIRSIIGGEDPNKVVDQKAYSEALEKSGYTREEAQRYWENPTNADPYSALGKEINMASKVQVPQVSIKNNEVHISAPKAMWESPVVKQLQKELQSLKGVDLSNAEVNNAIKSLNKELQDNWQNAMVQQALGWSPEEYKDYQYAIQAVSGTNPMSSSAYIKGKDKEGKIVKMTPQDWVDYWRKVYNTDERTDAFIKSYQSNDPYERTMALIMGQGKDTPVYGFDPLEQLGQGFAAFGNMVTKLPQGIMRIVGTDNTTKRIEEIGRNLSVPFASLSKIKVTNESDFNAKKEALKGKTWGELSDDDKAFLLILGASKESQNLNPATRDMVSGTKTSAGYRAEDLNKMSSDDAFISKQAIDNILVNNSYNDYKNAQDNFTTWQNYDEDVNQDDKRLEKNAMWSGASQWWGNIAGSMARYLWEAALIRAATGGINPKSITNPRLVTGDAAKALSSGRGVNVNAISDRIGDKLVETLGKHGISPASGFGKGMMDFTANLIGTIPEDILQTAIDNTLTYHSEDNDIFNDITNIPENFVNTFIWMAGLNALRVGKNAVARARLANAAKKAEFLNNKVNIDSAFADADEFSRAVKENRLKIDGDNVSIVDKNGNEKVLKDMDAKKAEIGRKIVNGEKVTNGEILTGEPDYNLMPYKGGTDSDFYKFVEANDPIEGIRNSGGSVTSWLAATDVEAALRDAATKERLAQLPKATQVNINNDANMKYLLKKYSPSVAFQRLGIDAPTSKISLDGSHANTVWYDIMKNQPSAATTATTEPTAVEENVQATIKDINEDVRTESESVRNWREQVKDAEDRLREVAPQKDAGEIAKMSYEKRKALAQAVADKSNGEYTVLYRVQKGAPDDFRPNDTSVAGKFEATGMPYLNGAVWLTSNPDWAEGSGRATAGIREGTPESDISIVAIPVKKSLIENVIYDGGDTTGKGYREKLKESGKKIVQTRGYEVGDVDGAAFKDKLRYQDRNPDDAWVKHGLDSTDPAKWGNTEFILWKQDAQDVFDDGMELMLKEHNAEADKVYNKKQARKIQDELDENNRALQAQLDNEAKAKVDAESVKAETEVPETKATETEKIIVEDEGPNGKVMEEVTDYNFRNHRDALDTKIENPTRAEMKNFHAKALDATMNNYQSFIDRFHNKFGDVQVSDFDWVRHQTQQGLTPDQIIGTKDPTTGRMIDQNKIDAMKWWAEQPEVKDLREASLKAMGDDEDYNILGYLPHTDYDPSNMDYDDAMKGIGMLWQKSTGASVMKDGNYVGYGGTFENRYRTFASNMLWDAKSKDIAASKLIEDAMLDGRQMSPELVEEAKKSVEGGRKIDVTVEKAASTKDIIKGLSDKSSDIDWSKMEENSKKDGAKVGLGQAIHDNYTIYRGHNKKKVVSQPEKFASLSFNFDQLSNNLRKIEVADIGNLYENGAAAMINSAGDAYELTARVFREGKTLREGIVGYLQDVSKRSSESADYIADKWVARVLDKVDNPTIANVSRELSKCMYNEGFSRVRRFLSLAKYDQFNTATRNAIDQFLFNKMQTDAVKNSSKITKFVTKALNAATHLRYEALFYGNVKNALLQLSELSRLFTTFKWGDVAKMAKRLATDADFKTRVDIYVDAIAPKTDRLTSELYQKYANTAEGMEVKKDGVKFKDIQNKMDDVGLAPINAAEAYKNRMMIAALVQEADSHKLTGNEAMRYIRKRYERVALAADEMGRIGLSSNPFARIALFLQNFQIRELGMHYYNLLDEGAIGEKAFGKAGKAYNQIKYLGKVFGTKLATTLILARLGYSATQTLGIDPFGLMNDYNKLDEDEMNELDKQISHGVLTPLFSGGMTSLISDLYFMARKSYEDSVRDTVSDEAERNLEKPGLLESLNIFGQTKWDDALSLDRIIGDAAQNFIPGAMTAKRISQMNELMNTGWATSAKGNKMYTAPDDIVNTVLGYLFGRNATANANQYNQTYGDNLFQTIGRFNPFREWGDFDPIDDKNYTDWFKGNENDLQQFNKGIYYFRDRRDEIIDAYEDAIRDSYSTADDSEAKNDMNQRLNELYDQLERFVKAYENKNGTITPTMVKQVINVLNTTRKNYQDTESEAQDRSTAGYADALSRYSSLDLPAVGTYTGPTEGNATKEVSYQGSPQWRAAISGYYDTADEAVAVLKEVDKKLSPIRKELKDAVSDAYTKKDWDALARIQKQYLKEFDNAVSPVIAAYGNSILKDTGVADQLRDMLSTGTNKKSANLIPSEQYAKNKYGKYQSMEYESVDVGKWAQKRFSGDTYTKPTVTSNTSAAEDLSEIKKLIRRGQNDRARARALQLKVRIDNQTRSLSSEDYKWLESYLNYKEGK